MSVDNPPFQKDDYESFVISAEFGKNMVEGETITEKVVSAIEQESGESADVFSDTTIQGQDVLVRVRGGEPGKVYLINVDVVTSTANTWNLEITMGVT